MSRCCGGPATTFITKLAQVFDSFGGKHFWNAHAAPAGDELKRFACRERAGLKHRKVKTAKPGLRHQPGSAAKTHGGVELVARLARQGDFELAVGIFSIWRFVYEQAFRE